MKTGYRVQDVMTNMPIKLTPDISVKEAAQTMAKHNVNSLLVVEEDKLLGIVIDEDFVRNLIAKEISPGSATVKDIMETKLITVEPDADLYKALVLMRDNIIRHLPVMQGEKLLGFLTQKDILKIQPELFDIVVESMDIREEERKLPPESEEPM